MSAVEQYLDELFDRLAGTGAPGRRVMAEAEDHLHAAAADAMARGIPAGQAELDAVLGFGSPAMVARKIRSAYGGGRLSRALSAAWLLTGLALAGLGVAYLAAAGRLGWQNPSCTVVLSSTCYLTGRSLVGTTTNAAIAATSAAAALLGRRLAIRHAGLAPARRGLALTAGVVLAIAAVAIGAARSIPIPDVVALHLWRPTITVIATALIECLAAAISLSDSRPRRYAR